MQGQLRAWRISAFGCETPKHLFLQLEVKGKLLKWAAMGLLCDRRKAPQPFWASVYPNMKQRARTQFVLKQIKQPFIFFFLQILKVCK